MATADDVIGKADSLVSDLQTLVDDGSFNAYRQFLTGLQQELIGARDQFSNAHPSGTAKPAFAGIVTKLNAAAAKAQAAQPTDASMRALGRSVATAISGLRGSAVLGLLRMVGG